MPCQPLSRQSFRRAALILGLTAIVMGVGFSPTHRDLSAEPATTPLPPELRYVPPDAALFVHLDVANVWASAIGKAARSANREAFDRLTTQARSLFGVVPEQVRSITLFWPRLKGPRDPESLGIAVTFRDAYDQKSIKAAFEKTMKGERASLHTPSDRLAVALIGLDASYATPPSTDKTGPLTAAIREAATGTHVVVAASNPANLPDELRGNDLPDDIRVFQPILRAESITGIIDLGRELSLEVRVTTTARAQAAEVEKALAFGVKLIQEGLSRFPMELGKDAEKDPALKDVFTLLSALDAGVKGVLFGATYKTTGNEIRARIAIPADQPYQQAFTAAAVKLRSAAARAQSMNNLKQISLALHNYHKANGSFPPAAVVNKAGKPMLSWRVLILPYIEQGVLYKQFKLDEPWDSPTNIKLLDKMPRVYAETVPTAAKANETHYKVFVGNGAAFDLLRGAKFKDFEDGTSNTILVVTASAPSPWTKPDDLAYDPEQDPKALLGFHHSSRVLVSFADGDVRGLSREFRKTTLHGAITRAGGEVLGPDLTSD